MNRAGYVILGMAGLLAAWFAFGDRLGQTTAKTPGPRELRVLPAMPPAAPLYGMATQIHHVYDVVNRTDRLIAEIADLGCNAVMLTVARYQENASSTRITIDPERMPTEEQWARIIESAHRRNLRVMLMPIVLLSDPRGTEWRGEISHRGASLETWWSDYRSYLLDMARMAAANRVEVMAVGSELVKLESHTEHWRRLIQDIRKVFPGRLFYSANWDHYKNIEFWGDLDYIGLTTYHQLSEKPGPTLDQLIEAWRPIKKEILDWQATVGKPIIFTEVGWCSQEGASVEAWNYYHKQVATPAGHEEQLRLYKAFMRTWEDVPAIGGVIWWEWTESPGGKDDYNYTPRGKPAEAELRRWLDQMRCRWIEGGAVTVEGPARGGPGGAPAGERPTSRPAFHFGG